MGCDPNCDDCQQGNNPGEGGCDACATGYVFHPQTTICIDYCPTGLLLDSDECEFGSSNGESLMTIAYFQFDHNTAQNGRTWEFAGSWDDTSGDSGLSHTWSVHAYGGNS